MKPWQREPKTMIIVAAMLFLLLPLLATLQYRWLGQVSEGEREQLKGSLRATARRFAQDFDHELTLAYAAFSPGAQNYDGDYLKDYVARYERWQTTAQHPQLVSEVFVASLDDQISLSRLDSESKQFTTLAWPAGMQALHERLEQHYQNIIRVFSQSSRPPSSDADASVRELLRRPLPPIAEEIPALVIPVLNPPVVRGNREISLRPTSRVVIVRLNQNYIQQELLPVLARRHFDGDKELNYNVAIVSRQEPRRILYQFGSPLSLSSSDQESLRADVTAGLFGLRFDEIRNLMRSRTETETVTNRASAVTPQPGEANNPGVTPSPRAEQSAGPPNEENRPWQMLIRHRAGSLEAAVASVRRRNLLLSFGIMALLTVSVALMMLSSRRAQRLARQQIEFVAGVSHELRTPLAVIRSAGENLADGVIRDNEQIKRYGKLIRDEGRRLTGMVEQVLEFAGAQSGRQKYELHPTSVSEIFDQARAATQSLIDEGGFELDCHLQPGLPDVLADGPALARALQNLLTNALKYSGENRWIGLGAQSVSNAKGSEIRITVEDKGLGISSAELPHIFEPFYRGSEVVAAQIHGNGLGLSLVKSIVEAHGGSVSVSSNPGRGSAFTIILPAAPPAKELTGEARSLLSPGR